MSYASNIIYVVDLKRCYVLLYVAFFKISGKAYTDTCKPCQQIFMLLALLHTRGKAQELWSLRVYFRLSIFDPSQTPLLLLLLSLFSFTDIDFTSIHDALLDKADPFMMAFQFWASSTILLRCFLGMLKITRLIIPGSTLNFNWFSSVWSSIVQIVLECLYNPKIYLKYISNLVVFSSIFIEVVC